MPRPKIYRRVEFFPDSTYFVPMGVPSCKLEQIDIMMEELEAMRLKDIEGLNQEECAKRMNVSRQTFQNIIDSARKKVAMSLTEGKAIKIGGGNYISARCEFYCDKCKKTYKITKLEDKEVCPVCGTTEVLYTKKIEGCRKWCRGDIKIQEK